MPWKPVFMSSGLKLIIFYEPIWPGTLTTKCLAMSINFAITFSVNASMPEVAACSSNLNVKNIPYHNPIPAINERYREYCESWFKTSPHHSIRSLDHNHHCLQNSFEILTKLGQACVHHARPLLTQYYYPFGVRY